MTQSQISELQKCGENIRHICILAHVDHGKTTLADSILASNGIIPKKMIGKMRFMDSRKDEQERGITMKSSSVAIQYVYNEKNYLVNLIDSPGHADFSGEVCTAVRLCDGAVILVDVVEGVCPQTKVALRQAWIEHLTPLLVLNKIDRLILEWKLTPLDAFAHLVQILEQVNAVMGELFASDVIKKSDLVVHHLQSGPQEDTEVFDWSSGLDDSDDSRVYFSPEQRNVVFASALDGWGFGISHFAKMYANKLGFKEEVLRKTLWGDFYLNSKTKRIMKGAQVKSKKPLFVQFILENIWSVYDAILVNQNKETVDKIVQTLNLKISVRDSKQFNSRNYLQVVMSQWLSLSNAVLDMVCTFVPSPMDLIDEKIESLMCSNIHKFDHLPEETRQLKKWFKACDSTENAPIIVCVSKMFPIAKDQLQKSLLRNHLIQSSTRSITADEIAARREKARQMQEQMSEVKPFEKCDTEELEETVLPEVIDAKNDANTVFVAFARIYSGTLRKGQKVYVLGPKHDPQKALKTPISLDERLVVKDLSSDQHITVATIGEVYLLMGEDVRAMDEVPAGNVVGIGGLEEHILKCATLSSTISCPAFVDLHQSTTPIMRVALEPSHPREMPALVQGMKLLNQADPCVQVYIQESGEHVLVTAGEVHLQRCVNDLKERFANVDINVSTPIVPFRETVIAQPTMDMVNEIIDEKSVQKPKKEETVKVEKCLSVKTPNKQSSILIKAVPLPPAVTTLLEQHSAILKEQDKTVYSLYSGDTESDLTEETIEIIRQLKTDLAKLFDEAGSKWAGAIDQIWSFGPKRCGPNVLLNRIQGYQRPSVWLTSPSRKKTDSPLANYDSSFISGFQLATFAGPLCDEPLMGVCFVVEEWTLETDITQDADDSLTADGKPVESVTPSDVASVSSSGQSSITPYGPFTGQIMSTVKEACKRAFQARPQRLMAAMYSCNIQVTADMLGKMYAVLGRRNGKVLNSDLQEGSQTFFVNAELPVIESFDFANEIRKQTSGMAFPQLIFSHWEVIDIDPFWVPHTEEEYAHFGEKADSENRARKYMNAIRKRKGLPVDEKIVEHAQKQRTLTRNK